SAGGQRAVSVIRALGFTAKYAHMGANPLGADTRAAEQSAAADRREYRVQVGNFLQQLLGSCGLPCDDAIVVVGMHQMGPSLRLDMVASGLPRRDRRLAENNFSAVALDGLDFH